MVGVAERERFLIDVVRHYFRLRHVDSFYRYVGLPVAIRELRNVRGDRPRYERRSGLVRV